MQTGLNQIVKKAEKETQILVSKARKEAKIAHWEDAVKYGFATSAIVVPVILLLNAFVL